MAVNDQAHADLEAIQNQAAQHNQATQYLEGKKDEREQTYTIISNDANNLDNSNDAHRSVISDDGMRIINRALRGSSEPNKAMPSIKAIARKDRDRNRAKIHRSV